MQASAGFDQASGTPEVFFGAPRERHKPGGLMSLRTKESAESQETHPNADKAGTLRAKECGERPRSIREAFFVAVALWRKRCAVLFDRFVYKFTDQFAYQCDDQGMERAAVRVDSGVRTACRRRPWIFDRTSAKRRRIYPNEQHAGGDG